MPRLTIAVACAALALGACGKDDEAVGIDTVPGGGERPQTAPPSVGATTGKLPDERAQESQTGSMPSKTSTTGPTGTATTKRPAVKSIDIINVMIKDNKFVPPDVVVTPGQTVRWINHDDAIHRVQASKGASFSSKILRRGQGYRYTPSAPGKVTYECPLHPGQRGSITVTE